LQRVKRRNPRDEIATRLRDYIFIFREALPPGHLPGEQEFCDLFGASRVSVREGLRLLEARVAAVSEHIQGFYASLFADAAVVTDPGEAGVMLEGLHA
jgi:DNA-binding FadR family transcriptional regulator